MTIALTRAPRLSLAGLAMAALLLSLSLAIPSWSQGTSKVVGIAAALVNEVSIRPASLTKYARANLRQRLAIADQVRTGANSRLQIALLDKTKVSVGANAQLTIDKFVFDPNGGSLSITAAKGALRFMSGATKSARTLRTPSATIGIRGTLFDTAVGELAVEIAQRERAIPQGTRHDPETATLAVLRGPGPNRQGTVAQGAIDVEAGGQTVALEMPLQASYVPYAGATPIGPFTISLPGLNLLNGFIVPPPPRPDFVPASQAYPVPNNSRREPPPWADPRFAPPPGAGPGPGTPGIPGVGGPGGFGTGLPGPGAFPPPTGGAVNQPPPTRTPQAAPTNTQPVGTPAGANNPPPTRVPQNNPNNPNNPPAGAAAGPNNPTL